MRKLSSLLLAAAVAGSGCTSSTTATSTVTADLVAGGQLFCTAAGVLYEAGTVKVTGATATAVQAACSALTVAGQSIPGATPTAAQTGAAVVLAVVASDAVTAVNASKPAGS